MSELTLDRENTKDSTTINQNTGEKTILVPDIMNMNTYLFRHCKTYLLGVINEKLVSGELSQMLGIPVVSERITADQCVFPNISYWRLNRTDFLADIDTQVQLLVETEAGDITEAYSFYISIDFVFNSLLCGCSCLEAES